MSRPNPTLIAADPTRSAWVAANAGAGKTYTLAARVTRLLLAGAPPEKILCLTYTKAAAAEMAGRLFAQLGKWAMLDDDALRREIETIGGNARDAESLRRARRLFAAALETPGGLKIQTIHAFCQHVLMRFPLEAGVPAGFRVLDERSARDLLADARARMFERAGSGDAPRAAAIAYLAEHMGDEGIAALIDSALTLDRGKLDAAFAKLGDPGETWSKPIRLAHGAREDDTFAGIAAECAALPNRDGGILREAAAWLDGGSEANRKTAAALKTAVAAADGAALRGVLLTKDGAVRAKFAIDKLVKARPDLDAALRKTAEALQGFEERKKALHAALMCEAALTLIEAVRDIYASRKRALNALDYDDLIVKTDALLKRGSAWVMYKLDNGIDHILIDEAQDTSARQWDIVQSLTEEFFAGLGARSERTLFAVGDEKQSIFSFQGADPKQFAERRDFFALRAREAECEFTAVDLPVSRRSAPEILSFVDKVFEAPEARDGLTFGGGAVRHEPLRFDLKGRVEFWPALKPEKRDAPDPWELRPVDALHEDGPLVALAKRIADTIAGWLDDGTKLPGHEQPIDPGDIMILLPRREPFGGEIIRRLKERGVPVAGADRLKLAETPAAMDLIALGRFALTPDDELNLAALLRSPLCGLSEDELFALAHGRSGRLWNELKRRRAETPAFAAAFAFLNDRRAAGGAQPFEFFAAAVNRRRSVMLRRLGAETKDAIEEFLSLALTYESVETPSLEGFLHWIGGSGAVVKRDMDRGRGEVRVMTVHGAKGLEADIVILPDTTQLPDGRAGRGNLLYTDDIPLFPLAERDAPPQVSAAKAALDAEALKEHRRLLYVALTRARQRLYVCGFENLHGRRIGSWHELAERAAVQLGEPTESGALVFGDESEAKDKRATPQAKPVAVPAWATHPPAREVLRPRLIRPSEAAGIEEPSPLSPFASQTGGIRRGLLAHALLARLPDIAPDLRRAAAEKYLHARGVTDEQREDLIGKVFTVLNDAQFSPAFSPESRAEVALAADLPELAPGARLHGRIDRLAMNRDEVLIVDFKTNRRPPDNHTDIPVYYAAQMALYRLAALKIFPNRRIACALVWTETPSLMTLPDDFLDAQTRRIAMRLTAADTVLK